MSGIKVSFGDISFGVEDIRRLAAAQWPIVGGREAVVTCSEPVRDEWKARAENAERERDEARDAGKAKDIEIARLVSLVQQARGERDTYNCDLEAELSGNAALRRNFGARPDETMCEFVARLVATVNELRSDLLRASLGVCKSCEGPLSCPKCVPVRDTTEVMTWGPAHKLPNDHEARIKALEKLEELLEGRVTAIQNRLDGGTYDRVTGEPA